MRFVHPDYLYALSLIPVLFIFYAVSFRQKARALARFGSPALLAKMAISSSSRRQRLKAGLILTGLALCIVALARPQLGTKVEVVKRQGIDLVIVLDISSSMLAEDVKPNRLERAKHAIRSLIDKLQGDRVGLVVFAGTAFLQCPLTSDYGAVSLFLDGVDTETISEQGTALGDALRAAMSTFNQQERKHKAVILLTDGEDQGSEPVEAAQEAANQGIHVYTIGIGSPTGEPIPIRNPDGSVAGYKQDRTGEVVMSRLDDLTLEKIASLTNGKYYRSTLDESELDQVYDDIAAMEKKEFESKEFSQYEERYQFLLLGGLVLLSLEMMLTDRAKVKREWAGRFE